MPVTKYGRSKEYQHPDKEIRDILKEVNEIAGGKYYITFPHTNIKTVRYGLLRMKRKKVYRTDMNKPALHADIGHGEVQIIMGINDNKSLKMFLYGFLNGYNEAKKLNEIKNKPTEV